MNNPARIVVTVLLGAVMVLLLILSTGNAEAWDCNKYPSKCVTTTVETTTTTSTTVPDTTTTTSTTVPETTTTTTTTTTPPPELAPPVSIVRPPADIELAG